MRYFVCRRHNTSVLDKLPWEGKAARGTWRERTRPTTRTPPHLRLKSQGLRAQVEVGRGVGDGVGEVPIAERAVGVAENGLLVHALVLRWEEREWCVGECGVWGCVSVCARAQCLWVRGEVESGRR